MASSAAGTGEQSIVGRMPPPPGKTPNFVNPTSSHDSLFIGGSILLATATLAVVARIVTRTCISRSLGWDDFTKAGFGYHVWDLPETPDYRAHTVKGAMGTIKLSVLFLYLRLFSVGNWMRYSVYACFILVAGAVISGMLSLMLGCRPVKMMYQWGNEGGTCIDIPTHVLAVSIINMITDFVILILPIPTIWLLHLPTRQKLAVMMVFSIGFFVCGISVLRIVLIRRSDGYSSYDYTWDEFQATLWSLVESTMALLCSCAPALKPLFRYLVPLAQRVTARASSSAPKLGSSLGSSVRPRKPSYPAPLVISGKSEDMRFSDGSYLELSPAPGESDPYTRGVLESHAYYQKRDKGSPVQSATGDSVIMKTVSVDIQPYSRDKPGRLSLFPPSAGR
ncbi:MAG: hypothetical protein M1815_002203 [Lichina confinis]|nr:MAG: hypothetical protein M1815_002203 [Lichina confinis]